MNLSRMLRRNFWLVTVASLSAMTLCGARGIGYALALGLQPSAAELAAKPLVRQIPAGIAGESRFAKSADPVLARNPFDHLTGPISDVPVAPASAAAASEAVSPWLAPACAGVAVLAISAAADAQKSFAALRVDGEAKSHVAAAGQLVGTKLIEYVGLDRVWLREGGLLCQAQLFRGTPPSPAPVVNLAIPSVQSGAPALDSAIAKGIVRISATEFHVDRGVVDKILENQSELMRSVRIAPEKDGDRVVGLRMFGVKPDSLLGTLGIENGDRLQTLNGFDVSNPERALEAYARIRSTDKLVVQLNRRGQNLNLDLHIR